MSLIQDNYLYAPAAEMLHSKKLSENKKSKIRAMYLEALITFCNVYAQTEIGDGIDLDITKIALYINSPVFENEQMFYFKNIDQVYELLEQLVIYGLPIWRFLKLSDYQQDIFERQYKELLISSKLAASKDNTRCIGCVWYERSQTPFGALEKCIRPRLIGEQFSGRRSNGFSPENIKSCKWRATLTTLPENISLYNATGSVYQEGSLAYFNQKLEAAREKYKKSLERDDFAIPRTLSENEFVDISVIAEDEPWKDFGCAFRNERTVSDRKKEIRKAMFIESMIRFFTMYAKSEIGSDFAADIQKISIWVDRQFTDPVTFNWITSYDDIYLYLEEQLISNTLNIKNFICKKTN